MKLAVWGGLVLVLVAVVVAGTWSLIRSTGSLGPMQASFLQNRDDYGAVPDFSLTERSGRMVTLKELRGRFWIADFIFTRCTGTCPILGARMTSLARTLSAGPADRELRFVSFTVDPDWDTPAVLNRYAASLGLADPRWLFLTGPRTELYRLIGEGFRLSVAQAEPGQVATGELITHSERFVLVDPEGRIRGYYHGSDEDSVRKLMADLQALR